MVVSLNYCSQNGGNLYRAPYYNGNPNIGPRIIGNLDQYPYAWRLQHQDPAIHVSGPFKSKSFDRSPKTVHAFRLIQIDLRINISHPSDLRNFPNSGGEGVGRFIYPNILRSLSQVPHKGSLIFGNPKPCRFPL